jgi:hypothetical protein
MIIYHHLGLGDHIICNGLVRHFAESNSISLLCKSTNIQNISFMFRDNKNITTLEVKNDDYAYNACTSHHNCLRCGTAVKGIIPDILWDEAFYIHADIPFSYSWSKFYYQRDTEKENLVYNNLIVNQNIKEYIFIHNQGSDKIDRINYNYINNNDSKIFTDINVSFFDYAKIIEDAKEVHCVNSSFKHFIDRIPTKGKLFYHIKTSPKGYDHHHSNKEWTLV